MLGRITISLAMAVALMTTPFHVSARTCIVSDAPVQKACKPGCCANKTCCATSKKNNAPISQPLAKNGSAPELSATCAVTLNAIAPDYVSLGEVTRIVLENNPAIQQALRKWNAAKARITQEAAWDDLRVSGSSRAARFVDVAPDAFTDQMASVEQAIPLTGKNLLRARAAAADAVAIFEQARREQLDVLAKARSSYFRLANAHAQLELNRKNLVSLRQIAEVSRSRYEVGKANAAEPLAGEVEASKLLESEQDILRNISAEQSQLNVLMNRDAFAPLGQPEEIRITSLDLSMNDARALLLASRPEIKIAQAKIDMEKSRVDLSRRNWIPDPAIKVEAQRYNDSAQAASEVDAGVSFTVPWINPAKYSAAGREAKENLAAV